jgi:hypothetical protein
MVQIDPISGAPQALPLATGPKRYGANAGFTATSGTLSKTGYRGRARNDRKRQLIQERLAAMKKGT